MSEGVSGALLLKEVRDVSRYEREYSPEVRSGVVLVRLLGSVG